MNVKQNEILVFSKSTNFIPWKFRQFWTLSGCVHQMRARSQEGQNCQQILRIYDRTIEVHQHKTTNRRIKINYSPSISTIHMMGKNLRTYSHLISRIHALVGNIRPISATNSSEIGLFAANCDRVSDRCAVILNYCSFGRNAISCELRYSSFEWTSSEIKHRRIRRGYYQYW